MKKFVYKVKKILKIIIIILNVVRNTLYCICIVHQSFKRVLFNLKQKNS